MSVQKIIKPFIGISCLLALHIAAYVTFTGLALDSSSLQAESLQASIVHENTSDKLDIIFRKIPNEIDPYIIENQSDRQLVDFIFQPLVSLDDFLNPKTELAINWGRTSDTQWEISLREGVEFSDGSLFQSDDVIQSFELLKEKQSAYFDDIFRHVVSIEKINDLQILITTDIAYPELLSSLSRFYISKKRDDAFIGTGDYFVTNVEKNKWELSSKNKNQKYTTIFIYAEKNKYARMTQAEKSSRVILFDFPEQFVERVQEKKSFSFLEKPGLNSYFLLFNKKNLFWGSEENTARFVKDIQSDVFLQKYFQSIGHVSHTIVPVGVFGSVPVIEPDESSLVELMYGVNSQAILPGTDPQEHKIWQAYPEALRKEAYQRLTQETVYINMIVSHDIFPASGKLKRAIETLYPFIQLDIIPQTSQKLLDSYAQGVGDMYFLGWDFSSGTVRSFVENMILSDSSLSQGYYKHLDADIVATSLNFDDAERGRRYREIIDYVTIIDPIGVPLFLAKHKILISNNIVDDIILSAIGLIKF